MSDQTPNSTEDLTGSEPSMEDILASIRKIISEDEPVALESPEDPGLAKIVSSEFGHAPDNLVSDAVADTQFADLAHNAASDNGSSDLNIDDVLAGLDEDIISDEPAEIADLVDTAALSGGGESDDDIPAFPDKDISLDSGNELDAVEDFVLPSSELNGEMDLSALNPPDTKEDSEIDALLDDILTTPEDKALEIAPEAPDGDLEDDLMVSEEESDLELVKSLMADLADDPGGLESDEDLDALLEIPDMDAAEALDAEDLGAEDDDILGDILDMTLTDELEAQPDDIAFGDMTSLDDVAAAEQDNIFENELDLDTPDFETSEFEALELETSDLDAGLESLDIPEPAPSLSDIAAAAEADAVAVETNAFMPAIVKGAGAAVGGAGLAAFGLKAANAGHHSDEDLSDALHVDADSDDIDVKIDTFIDKLAADESSPDEILFDETSADEPITETTKSLSNQETSMPVKAVKSDAIIDEVTETATAGAFAELNQVVEDKAVFNESGPRIGDLVQDALRPMLKEWLDANLKGIVERAVTKEVKRISSGK